MEKANKFADEGVRAAKEIIRKMFKSDKMKEQERQVLGAYIFGFLNGLGQEMKVSPVDIHGIMVRVLISEMHYSAESAAQFGQFLIDSTDRNFHSTMYAIIHRGLEGYYLYEVGNLEKLESDFEEILDIITKEDA